MRPRGRPRKLRGVVTEASQTPYRHPTPFGPPECGNTAEYVVSIRAPKETNIFEGYAAPQTGDLKPFETIIGDANQVYIPCVNPDWIIP